MRLSRIVIVVVCFLTAFKLSVGYSEILVVPVDPYSSEIDIYKANKLDGLTISAATNEIESASFYIKNSSIKPITISLESTNLQSQESTIESSVIDIKYVLEWYQSNGAWYTHRQSKYDKYKPTLVRELLVRNPEIIMVDRQNKVNSILVGENNKNYIDISKKSPSFKDSVVVNAEDFYIKDSDKLESIKLNGNDVVQVWVTFKPLKNMTPGFYKGGILIKEGGEVIKSQEINLKIHNFALDDPRQSYSIYYRGYLASQGSISSEAKSAEQLAAEFVDMREHGITDPTVYQRISPKEVKLSKTELRERFEQYLKIRSQSGFSNNIIYYLGLQVGDQDNQNEIDSFNSGLSELKKLLEKYGASDIYIYGKEEVIGRELSSQIPLWNKTKEKGYKLFVASSKGFFQDAKSAADLLIYYDKIEPDASVEAHRNQTKIFSYSNPQVGVENPLIYRNNYGFHLISAGFDGVMDYAYQHSMGFIWNDFDNEIYRDHVFAYPTSNGVIDTIAWEGFREAVDDARYYSTAANRIRQSQGVEGEEKLYKWLISQCNANICDSENIRKFLIKIIYEN